MENYIDRYRIVFIRIYRSINNMIKNHVHTDITVDQFSILHFIHKQKLTTTTEMAQTFGVGKSAITAFVNRLVEKDLLQRKRDEQDRRIIHLSLTEKGIKAVLNTEEKIHKFLNEKLTEFDVEDVEKFLKSLEKLAALMEQQ